MIRASAGPEAQGYAGGERRGKAEKAGGTCEAGAARAERRVRRRKILQTRRTHWRRSSFGESASSDVRSYVCLITCFTYEDHHAL